MAKVQDTITVEVEYGAAMTALLDVRDRSADLFRRGQDMGSRDFWEDGIEILDHIVITIEELIQAAQNDVPYEDAKAALDKAYGIEVTATERPPLPEGFEVVSGPARSTKPTQT